MLWELPIWGTGTGSERTPLEKLCRQASWCRVAPNLPSVRNAASAKGSNAKCAFWRTVCPKRVSRSGFLFHVHPRTPPHSSGTSGYEGPITTRPDEAPAVLQGAWPWLTWPWMHTDAQPTGKGRVCARACVRACVVCCKSVRWGRNLTQGKNKCVNE